VKVFILKPSSLGDVVQALPVLRLIKLQHPGSEIYWWLDQGLTPLLEGDPDLAGIIPFNRKRWSSPWHWNELWSSVRAIREHHFDWVIDLQSLLRSGAMAWFARGGFTVGLDDSREGARGFYDVIVPRRSYATHAVDWYLDVLPALDVPVHRNFDWLPERAPVARAVREKWRPEGSRWIALQPGARWLNKRWPAEYFAATAKEIASSFPDVRFAIFGGAADQPLAETITRALPDRCLDLAGKTSLAEMIEWTRLCEVMVTNDTGPMHVAAALGKPVVGIFGPTDPRRTGPYRQSDHALQHSLPCVPCMKDTCRNARPLECLHAIRPSDVAARVMTLLANAPTQSR
jgi:heptosyltransferase I